MASHDLFLSCVSDEFHHGAPPGTGGQPFVSYRTRLAESLQKAGLKVAFQETFAEGGGDLLQKLQDYIRGCGAVVHLVGYMTGATAKADEVHALLARETEFLASRPGLRKALGDCLGISYTQWEALLALHHGVSLLRFAASDHALRSPSFHDDPDQRARQRLHRHRLEESGIFAGTFLNHENLCLHVLEALYHLPRPIPWPLLHNLPFVTLGTLFKGRDTFLRDLRATLTGARPGTAAAITQLPPSGAQPAAIHALGGVGKSRTAVEYAWLFKGDYHAVLWVLAAAPGQLQDGLAALAALFHLPEAAADDPGIKEAAVLQHLHTHPGWLLILDNVDTPMAAQAVHALLPHLAAGHVLITTRLDHWAGDVRPLALETLTEEAGAAFLLERTQARRPPDPQDDAQALQLARRLEGLALALEQAGAYIHHRRIGLRDYIERLEHSTGKLLRWHDATLMQYPRSVAETLLITIDQLTDHQRFLFFALAWFDAQPLPLWVFDHLPRISDLSPGLEDINLDKNSAEDALSALYDWHLVRHLPETRALRMHRLVQEITLLNFTDKDERSMVLAFVLIWFRRAIPDNSEDVQTWPRWETLQSHALCLARHAEAVEIWQPAVHLRNDVSHLLAAKARYAEAEVVSRQALALAEAHLPPDDALLCDAIGSLAQTLHATRHLAEAETLMRRVVTIDGESSLPRAATHLNDLAVLLQDTGRYVEAETLLRQALKIDQANFGPEHVNGALRLNNLAHSLKHTGQSQEAEALTRQALAIFEKHYGPQHPKVAAALGSLASLLQDSHRTAEAEPLLRRALAIGEVCLGPEHPSVGTALNGLAALLMETHRYNEAEPLFRRALAINEAVYGVNHPSVAVALGNLATLLKRTGRPAEAEPMLRRALAIDEAVLGPESTHVASDLNNLAQLLHDTQRFAEAEPLMRRALKTDETVLGPAHPSVALRLSNLAQLLTDTNRLAEAEPLIRRAVAIDESVHEAPHPAVARSIGLLAGLLHATSRTAEAELLMQRALAITEAAHDPNHPAVADALNPLAVLLWDSRRYAEAEPLMRHALAIHEAAWGPDHTTVARDVGNLAALLFHTQRLAEAEPLMRRALQIFETTLGPNDPQVAIHLNNLAQLLQDLGQLAEAELLMRRALAIDEATYGPDHPFVSFRLNNLAMLLKDTQRLAEAEPLMRQSLLIYLRFFISTGREHSFSPTAVWNYLNMLNDLHLPEADLPSRLNTLADEVPMDRAQFAALWQPVLAEIKKA